jgi:hypothetical protein
VATVLTEENTGGGAMSNEVDVLKFDYNTMPICPYCEQIATRDAWELGLDGDGDSCEMECKTCGETIMVIQNINVDYSTKKREGK